MWELERKLSAEELMLLNCVGEDSWEYLGRPGNPPVHPKGNQSWIFIGRTDAEVETPILWSPDMKNWLIWKDPDAGKDWRQEEKGTTEDEMVRWHHWRYGHEFEWALGVGDGQGGLVCCSPWGCKELDTTVWLNWTELNWLFNLLQLGIVYPWQVWLDMLEDYRAIILQNGPQISFIWCFLLTGFRLYIWKVLCEQGNHRCSAVLSMHPVRCYMILI